MLTPDERFFEHFNKLIRWASNKYSRNLVGRFDYWDFLEEGTLILALCLYKWRKKDEDLKDQVGFTKYFKTALFNRFRQILIMSHSGKRKGMHVQAEEALKISCDGGFGEIFFKELADYVKLFLTEEEQYVFDLMLFPPQDLVQDAIYENARKQKSAAIGNTYNSNVVKVTSKCLHRFINKTRSNFSENHFFSVLRNIRKVVRMVILKEEGKLQKLK
jgi:hypothetical protein